MVPLSIALMLIGIGIILGAWIARVVRWLRRPATIPRAEFIGYQPLPPTRRDPPPMPTCKPARDADMWDVAEEAEHREERAIDYRFIGLMGDSES